MRSLWRRFLCPLGLHWWLPAGAYGKTGWIERCRACGVERRGEIG